MAVFSWQDIELKQIQADVKQTPQTEASDSFSTSKQAEVQQLSSLKLSNQNNQLHQQPKSIKKLLKMEQKINQKLLETKIFSCGDQRKLKKIKHPWTVRHKIALVNIA